MLLALIGACYRPLPPEGAPCQTSAECPTPLQCFANECRAEPGSEPPGIDAPGVDAPPTPPDPSPNAGCPDALQCDSFEDGDLEFWVVQRTVSDATVIVTTDRAHSGMRSVVADVPAKPFTGSSAVITREQAPQSTGVLAARAWIFSPGPITNFSGVLQLAGDDRYVMVSGSNANRWTVTENGPTGLFDHDSTVVPAAAAWTCVELEYTFSPARIRLYIDEALVIESDASNAGAAFTEISAGVARAPLEGFRVFVDDFVVANQRIGCN